MNNKIMQTLPGGGGSPEQSQEVICGYEIDGNHEQSSARRGKPRFDAQARALAFCAKGGEPSRAAFTMAEILLSLTIIGVVAAITLPSLTGNINERTWNTQRKALYSRMQQAISLMPSVNGYGTQSEDTTTERFIIDGLGKVLKMNNVCNYEKLGDCGIPTKFYKEDGTVAFGGSIPTDLAAFNPSIVNVSVGWVSYSQANIKAAAFETANGESILVHYNPFCQDFKGREAGDWAARQNMMCANFIYDLNGKKGPNKVGQDMGFITVLYPSDSTLVAPMPNSRSYKSGSVRKSFQASGEYCRSLGDYRVPNLDEAHALFYNRDLIMSSFTVGFWTSEKVQKSPASQAWGMTMASGSSGRLGIATTENGVLCISR